MDTKKDVESFTTTYQQLSDRIRRFGLLRVAVMGVIVFAYVHAFQSIDQAAIDKSERPLRLLSRVTGRTSLDLRAAAFQDFFLVRNLLIDYQEENRIRQDRLKQTAGPEWTAVAALLPPDVVSKIGQDIIDLGTGTLAEEVRMHAERLQLEHAAQIRSVYANAFAGSFSLVGVPVRIDLRNWFALLPFLLILSEIYLFIERRKLAFLRTGIARLSRGIAGAYSRLFFDDMLSVGEPAFARHPTQFIDSVHRLLTFGLVAYFVYAVSSSPMDLAPVIVPATIMVVIASSYGFFYCREIANELKRHLDRTTSETEGAPPPNSFVLTRWFHRLASKFGPRWRLTSGSVFLVSTLFMGLALGSCFEAIPGHRFLRNPLTYSGQVLDDGTLVWSEDTLAANPWAFAEIAFERYARTEFMTPGLLAALKVDQLLSWLFYVCSLLLVVMTIPALLMVWFRRHLPQLFARLNCLLAFLCFFYFSANVSLYFLSPRLRIAVLVLYTVTASLFTYLSAVLRKTHELPAFKGWSVFRVSFPFALAGYALSALFLPLGFGFFFLLMGTHCIALGYLRLCGYPQVGITELSAGMPGHRNAATSRMDGL